MSGSEDEFSDELDEFEESAEEAKVHQKMQTQKFDSKPFDEAYELSQDLSVAESYDGRGGGKPPREQKLTNDMYDEAVEVSQSMNSPPPKQAQKNTRQEQPKNSNTGGANNNNNAATASGKNNANNPNVVANNVFDEALEFSQSGSDESIDTQTGRGKHHGGSKPVAQVSMDVKSTIPSTSGSFAINSQKPQQLQPHQHQQHQQNQHHPRKSTADEDEGSSSASEEGDAEGEQEESYDNIEGAYNPKDYNHLNVAAEVKDLFQYIERYKPHEVELDTTLKCFVPEYIPAIGEIDGFIKVARPDNKDDGLGFRMLDEPATIQSDSTVLELQLRATSKKQQYGDIVVRSIENAEKNPAAIEKWIQNINDLHRSKPPPQVHYKKNMPDIETLMDVWPESFEQLLHTLSLPSPDLDLSLHEYVKILCSILDIPVYDNPIESLHVMFSLFMDFRDNPHFQAMKGNGGAGGARGGGMDNYGGADVMELNNDYK